MADEKENVESVESAADETQEQKISLFLAIGMVIGALAIGLVVGYLVAPKESVGAVNSPTGIGGDAPTLSPEQLEGGQLPTGHPPVDTPEEGSAGTGTTDSNVETDSTGASEEGTGTEDVPADGADSEAETESDS